jgi:hypothetical protein
MPSRLHEEHGQDPPYLRAKAEIEREIEKEAEDDEFPPELQDAAESGLALDISTEGICGHHDQTIGGEIPTIEKAQGPHQEAQETHLWPI